MNFIKIIWAIQNSDYNMAEKMYETGTLNTSSRKIGMKHAKNDWKRFLFAIADFCSVDLHLSFNISEPETKNEIKDIMVCIIIECKL